MLNRVIPLEQLALTNLSNRENQQLHAIISRGHWGYVKVVAFDDSQRRLLTKFKSASAYQLIVLGEPNTVAAKLVSKLSMDVSTLQPAITIVLTHAHNWVQQWEGMSALKLSTLTEISNLTSQTSQALEKCPNRYSKPLIRVLLSAISRAIEQQSTQNFIANLGFLQKQCDLPKTADPV